ncbi:GcvH family protein [Enterococcus moraviensis ATCC BAA-383]|uniref:GcvH family protein n=1 Tax=Enterococcus moraviensis ATCC BAA-383 TaxID=1158609 RepID=R2QTY4_9ENTE|nr:glycine cleavage system protein H [Enterococcus moraviensis]EOH98798.1 GcvH family protein [Enterococcus moraviensis ATCC BAA-383]EOT72027.1 GcvH family protein [Enterococcus moraviensis ATCC BAA-383]OJG68147.1 GcvH family protein [Enterococcus moraviensis]
MAEELKIIDNLWVLKTNEGYKIGLTNETQEDLGTITFATMPKVGQTVKKGDSLIELEAEKAVSEFSTPISGLIVAINEAVEQDTSVLDDPDQKNAWIAVLTDVDEAELNQA